MRTCAGCESDISHKRRDAKYCSRACKTKASDVRRREDGRAKARDRARYPAEREKRIAQAKVAYWRDPVRGRGTSAEWRKSHPLRRRAQHARRRARQFGNPGFIGVSEKDWLDAVRIAGGRCAYCGAAGELVMDHIIPLSRGGRHAPANITPACVSCNSSKSDSFVTEWRHRRLPPSRRR